MNKSTQHKKDRIKRVIMGCETKEQFETAMNYCERFCAGNADLSAVALKCCLEKERGLR